MNELLFWLCIVQVFMTGLYFGAKIVDKKE
jgi:hypothetical protein